MEYDLVHIIGFIHLIYAIYGFYITITDIAADEYPVSIDEIYYTIFHFTTHIILVFCLQLGNSKKKYIYFLPWLTVFLFIFTIMTYLWMNSLYESVNRSLEIFISNIAFLGVCWSSWIIVFRKFHLLRKRSRLQWREKRENFEWGIMKGRCVNIYRTI
ncbi:uncharacterized protein LOC115885259 [Sitophilus oryzae]|uniref:Uncharacterized protein LOC115885259 n=1 Tax=Sitophilus oryzae TaxID=7048 RepID=A0A6J2Y815_SITOR|nr:uncharacterized protein LOC115885259 [Sitophilus oryzae]